MPEGGRRIPLVEGKEPEKEEAEGRHKGGRMAIWQRIGQVCSEDLRLDEHKKLM